jgi:hypothetical protein
MGHIYVSGRLEQLAGKVARISETRRSHDHLARIGLCVSTRRQMKD